MIEAAALVQRILDAPDDDAPRLVYADWLLEQDDPRGELIQLQCAYAADPDDSRRRAMKIRENKLMKAHEAAWLGPILALLPPASWIEQYSFEWVRGFIESARITVACMAQLPALVELAPLLRGLELRPDVVADGAIFARGKLDGVLDHPLLARFTALTVTLPGGGDLVAHEVANAPTLANLTHLDLAVSVWGDAVRFYPAAEAELLTLTGDGARELARSPHLRNVRHLRLDSNRISLDGIAAIANAPWRLETLDLGHNGIDEGDLVAALDGPALANLRVLRLAGNAIDPDGAARLARAKILANLRELDLESCGLGAKGTEAFCQAFALPALRRLRLERNSLGDAGGKAVAACAGFAALTSFEAGHNRMGVKGGTAIATSPHLAKLERLLLNEPRWKPEMTAVFAESPTLANAKIYLKGRLVARDAPAPAKQGKPKPKRSKK